MFVKALRAFSYLNNLFGKCNLIIGSAYIDMDEVHFGDDSSVKCLSLAR